MASYARCLLFLFFAISSLLQIHSRESKFFSKVTKTTMKNNADSISLSPALSPNLPPALSPEPEVVEHGYGLYGRDPYENKPTKTVMPAKDTISGEEEKYVPAEELSQNNDDNYVMPAETPTKNTNLGDEKYVDVEEWSKKKGNAIVNGNKYEYSPTTRNPVFGEHKYVSERQGMSDTRFLENGKYYYDVNQDSKDGTSFVENEGDGYVGEKLGMSDTRFMENGKYFYDVQNQEGVKGNNEALSYANNNKNDKFQQENNGMSDTRYLNNGKYFYDVNLDNVKDNNNENEQYEQEKPGMSDTRYLDNGKYFYAANDENVNNRNYEIEGRGGYNSERNTNSPNQYVAQGRKGNYGGTKKLPNEYDTMEEYDREQGYIDPRDVYNP